MSELVEARASDLAYYGQSTARSRCYRNHREVQLYCRHARQPIDQVEQWPVPKFRSYLRILGDLLDKEWEAPDE